MKQLTFYFDVISPCAYLAFERLPQALVGVSYSVSYRPVWFAALLAHGGRAGQAEIEAKRERAFGQAASLAERHGIDLQAPAAHPFDPLALLRLAWACASFGGTPNRYACERLLRHVWQGGADATDPARLAALSLELAPAVDPSHPDVEQALRDATASAAAHGVFGVPTIEVDGQLFSGLDSLDMLAARLRADMSGRSASGLGCA